MPYKLTGFERMHMERLAEIMNADPRYFSVDLGDEEDAPSLYVEADDGEFVLVMRPM